MTELRRIYSTTRIIDHRAQLLMARQSNLILRYFTINSL